MKVKIEELKYEDLEKDLRPLDFIVQRHHGLPGSRREVWERRKKILKKAFKTGMYGLIVAREKEDNTIVAFLDYWIIHCFVEGFSIAFLQNMRVLEHYRGKGIGTLLVKKLKEIAEKRKCGEIHVIAGIPADKFYLKCGFHYKPSDIYLEARVEEILEGRE